MKYIVATTEGQPKNQFGGKNFRFVKLIEADGIKAAKKAAAECGKEAVAVLPSEWEFLSCRANDARIAGLGEARS